MSATKVYEEMVEFFARGLPRDRLLKYRPSRSTRERAHYLLDRRRTGKISAEEQSELDRVGELEHLMQLIKARARLHAKAND
jgi:hypothetical protein